MTSRSSTTTERAPELPPVHPGEILLEDFLKPMGISRYGLAKTLGVPAQRIHDLVHGRRAMTADTALRLARYFAMEAQFWMICRPATTSRSHPITWPGASNRRSNRERPNDPRALSRRSRAAC